MAYAAVPLYDLFCQVTGYGGTTQRAERRRQPMSRPDITVRFDANVARDLAWNFEPDAARGDAEDRRDRTGRLHAPRTIDGRASRGRPPSMSRPIRPAPISTRSSASASPSSDAETRRDVEMPVVFFVDPAIVNDPELEGHRTITLSYTFFPTRSRRSRCAAKRSVGERLKHANAPNNRGAKRTQIDAKRLINSRRNAQTK